MKRIQLHKLTLKNFKGIRSFELSTGGASADVLGANAAGKTSISDAFHFLLFGTDSQGRKNFDIKTLDAAGQTQRGMEHTVEGTFSVDGELITLSRTYKENWTRKRGTSHDEMTGHTTNLHVDGVPVKLGEFDDRVADILQEDAWRLLSDPSAFPRLPWQERRTILLDIVGDITDEDVINSDPTLADLPGILGKRSIEEHQKVVAARRAEINKELVTLPARIDEVLNGRPELPASTREELQAVIDDLILKRSGIDEERSRIQSGGEIADLQRQLAEVKTRILDVERRVRADVDAEVAAEREKLVALDVADDQAGAAVRNARAALQAEEDAIKRLDAQLAALRTEHARIVAQAAPEHTAESCSACGQALPAEQVQAAHEKALAAFNQRRAAALEENQAQGKHLKAERDGSEARLPALRATLEQAEAAAAAAGEALTAQHQHIRELQASTPDATRDAEHQKLTEQAATLTGRLSQVRTDSHAALQETADRLAEVDAELTELRGMLALFDQHARATARVGELEAQERTLNQEFERLERELFLMDEFTRTKVALLESKVASNFGIVNFRLFRTQVNGGLAESCDMTVNGVPFESLNRAAQVQAGIDVIKALQRHHEVSTPVWVDGRESVTKLPEIDAQVISLTVSPTDRNLRVELHSQEVAA